MEYTPPDPPLKKKEINDLVAFEKFKVFEKVHSKSIKNFLYYPRESIIVSISSGIRANLAVTDFKSGKSYFQEHGKKNLNAIIKWNDHSFFVAGTARKITFFSILEDKNISKVLKVTKEIATLHSTLQGFKISDELILLADDETGLTIYNYHTSQIVRKLSVQVKTYFTASKMIQSKKFPSCIYMNSKTGTPEKTPIQCINFKTEEIVNNFHGISAQYIWLVDCFLTKRKKEEIVVMGGTESILFFFKNRTIDKNDKNYELDPQFVFKISVNASPFCINILNNEYIFSGGQDGVFYIFRITDHFDFDDDNFLGIENINNNKVNAVDIKEDRNCEICPMIFKDKIHTYYISRIKFFKDDDGKLLVISCSHDENIIATKFFGKKDPMMFVEDDMVTKMIKMDKKERIEFLRESFDLYYFDDSKLLNSVTSKLKVKNNEEFENVYKFLFRM